MSTVQTSTITGVWHVDPKHSNLDFAVQATAASRRSAASLGEFTGTLDASGDELRLIGTGVTASLSTGDAGPRRPPRHRPTSSTPSATPSCASSSTAFEVDGEDVVVHGDLTLRGATRPVELRGDARGPRRRRVRHRPLRPRADGQGRPHRLRHLVERPAARRRLPALQHRHASTPRSRSCTRVLTMRLLGISGSLRGDSFNAAAAAAGLEHVPDGWSPSTYDGLPPHPAVRRGCRGARPGGRGRVPRGHRGGRRGPVLDAGVQLVHPGAAQERARLGVAAVRDQPAAQPPGGRGLGQRRTRSAASGPRPSCARCSPASAPASSTPSSACPRRHVAFDDDGRLLDPELDARLADGRRDPRGRGAPGPRDRCASRRPPAARLGRRVARVRRYPAAMFPTLADIERGLAEAVPPARRTRTRP